MRQARRQRFGRFGILAIVVSGHVLLLLLFTSPRTAAVREKVSTQSPRTVLVLLDAQLRREPPEETPAPTFEKQPSRELPGEPTEAMSTADDSDAMELGPRIGIPEVDWQREAKVTIDAMAPRIAKEMKRKCSAAKRSGAAPPEGCKKDSYEADWEPEPDRAGVSGLIPYIRLGKRCVVGLGFFGCNLGKLPQADGTLFEDMRDPNRPHSSVPDIDNSGSAELPPPIVLREQ